MVTKKTHSTDVVCVIQSKTPAFALQKHLFSPVIQCFI